MMIEKPDFYIDGRWIAPHRACRHEVIDPSTGQSCATIQLGSQADLDDAVMAARRAFEENVLGTREARLALLKRIIEAYGRRKEELAQAISLEMGAPITLAREAHVPAGLGHFNRAREILMEYSFDQVVNTTRITREPIGVCGFITPWNWPLNQMACKIAPALAAGCTIILKPSELAPLSAVILAEIIDEAGTPPGVFNLVHGDGPGIGAGIATHPGIDMVSFTGSTRAGILVAQAAAETVKRVTQELGGKSPNLILEGADFIPAIRHAATACFRNTGQSCNAPTRLFVPRARQQAAVEITLHVASALVVGDPQSPETTLGPLSNAVQFAKVNAMIEAGIAEGAKLVHGGPGRPENMVQGYFVAPTVFADVTPDMRIAREEIFGPVLSILPYDSEDEAIAMANDTVYGLSAYVTASSLEHARLIARRLRAGMVHLNGARGDNAAAFGGYKQSGNGREWGHFGFEEFLEVKSMFGFDG